MKRALIVAAAIWLVAFSATSSASAHTTSTTDRPSRAPTVTSQTPAPGASGVSVAAAPTATFSRAMNASSLTSSTFTLSSPSGAVAAGVAYNSSTKTATLSPNAALTAGATYTARLDGLIQAADGTALGSTLSWTFTAIAPPEVLATTPAAGATDVAMSIVPTVQLSRPMDTTTITTANVKLIRPDGTTVPVLLSYTGSSSTITIQPQGVLDYSASFTIQLGTGLHAADGTALAAQFTSTFTTTATGVTTRIDAGSTSLSHASGWAADWGFVGGTARTVNNTITGPGDPALYQSERYGAWQYGIGVPNGVYDLRLHFVELTYNQPSMRIFSVDVLNTATLNDVSNLDIYAQAGQNNPWIVTIPNVSITARSLRLKAVTNVGEPEIAAIEIIPHAPTAATP